jgi:putative inorganic carbon (hco3(-)) transporter
MSRKKKPYDKTTSNDHQKPYARKKRRGKENTREPLVKLQDIPFGFLILAYIFIVTFTPNWMALDTNAPKFWTLSLVNIMGFLLLVSNKSVRQDNNALYGFFHSSLGLVYAGFLLVSLLSFTQSINILESVLHFAKLFSVFSAVYILTAILMRDLRYVKMIVAVMTLLLLFDAFSVFYYINKFIGGEVARISDIKTVYSNKNILASSIFVKLPFSIWMMMFGQKIWKRIGWIAFASGVLATFFMATRAFFLGLLVLSLAFLAYKILLYFRQKEIRHLRLAGSYIGAIALAFLIFTVVQRNLYPEAGSRHTQGVGEQLASIREFDRSASLRLDSWKWSLKLIKSNPLLGVGSGNWKVAILEHENKENPGFIYLYKAHNDFLENTAEKGIPGGLLFLAIFVLAGWNFMRYYRKKADEPDDLYAALFLAAAGLAFYAVDAFFNFPADRPEILLLFALFLSTGIASAFKQKDSETAVAGLRKIPAKSISIGVLLLMGVFSWILYQNFQSTKHQRIVYQEIMAGRLMSPADRIVGHFPNIPEISIWGESIGAIQARYLLNEDKDREVIDLLADDHSNPYDGRREFFLATAYNNLEEYDSAMYYAEKAYEVKPYYLRNIHLLTTLLEKEDRLDEIPGYLDAFLEKEKRNRQAWLIATTFLSETGESGQSLGND